MADTAAHRQGLQDTLLKPLVKVLIAVAPVSTSGPARTTGRGASYDDALDLT